jgi:hypothetical protein
MAQICADQVSAGAAQGVPGARWLVEDVGYLRIIERDREWMQQAAEAIEHALA